ELLASGSKEGKLYVLDRNELGHFQPTSERHTVQSFWAGPGWLLGTPTYWHGPAGSYVYTWCSESPGRAFRLGDSVEAEVSKTKTMAANGILDGILKVSAESHDPAFPLGNGVLTEFSSTNVVAQGFPGGILSISANGTTAGTGILWAALGLSSAAAG